MTKFFFKFKKPIFGTFPQFWGKKSFSKKSGCHAQLYRGFQHPGKIQRNLKIKFQENTQIDVRREGWTNPISWDLSSYYQGANKYNCSRLALFKSQNKKCDVGLIKNYCITVSMQKIVQSINLFSRFQGLKNYMTAPIFDQAHPKNCWNNFLLS